MARGPAPEEFHLGERGESAMLVAPPAVLATIVFTLGLWIPPALEDALRQAARVIGGPR